MELKIEQVAIPEKIAFNYEELKQELSDKVKMYETLVYTDDQIKSAKADRADLNRLKKALNDERIRREREYMRPFNDFKTQINEIIGIIDKPAGLIDKQIREYEECQKQEKEKRIAEYFESRSHLEWLTMSMIFDIKWLNASVSMKSIQEAIDSRMAKIESDLAALDRLPEFAFEAIETYKTTLDLNKSIAEGHRLSEIQKRKADQERIKTEQEKERTEQERLRKEQENAKAEQEETLRNQMMSFLAERGRQAAAVTPEEIAESAKAYREAANVNGVHMSEELSKQWVSFKAFLSVADARALKEFFESRTIEFSRI